MFSELTTLKETAASLLPLAPNSLRSSSLSMASSDYPPTISSDHETSLLALASDYSLSNGLILRPLDNSSTQSIHAPYSLYPTPFPSHLFSQALSLQTRYNELYAKITTDDQFLERVVGGNVARVDEFQGKLYEIWKTVKKEGVKQVRFHSFSEKLRTPFCSRKADLRWTATEFGIV